MLSRSFVAGQIGQRHEGADYSLVKQRRSRELLEEVGWTQLLRAFPWQEFSLKATAT